MLWHRTMLWHRAMLWHRVSAILAFFARPVVIVRAYRWQDLRPDLIAGLTVAIVTLPQAMAYALIAELPPQVGLYAAIVGAVVGALWGSSAQLQTGPSNTTSLLVLSVLLGISMPGTPEYLAAAGMMALLVGIFRLAMGLARLGVLVNFVSDAVIVGFTAGAGILILANQLRHLFRLDVPSAPGLGQTLSHIAAHITDVHWISLIIGASVIVLIVVLRKANRNLPGPLVGMATAALVVGLLQLDVQGVRVIGELPRNLPPLRALPLLDWDRVGKLFTGSMTVAAVGLVETVSIARTIASQTGQRLDSNQEFVGQGLANIAAGFFSGYTCSGSFARSAVNFEAGAQTALSSVFGSLFVLIAMLLLAPLAAYVPLPALAGVLILTALGLIDRQKIARIWRSGHGDRFIMVATMLATLALPLEFAALTGIVMSVIYYLLKTSTPRVRTVLPDDDFRHFVHQPAKPACPQLGIVEILGDLYFGAVHHIEECIRANLEQNPSQRFLLLRMHTVENCDISGIYSLEGIVRTYRERHGDVYLVRVRQPVLGLMQAAGFYDLLGEDHFLDPDRAIDHLFYRVIDPAVCIYECPVRAFAECQNLPKMRYPGEVHLDVQVFPDSVPAIAPRALWEALARSTHAEPSPQVIDVRAPREFQRGHIPVAQLIPLPFLLNHIDRIPTDRPVVLVCRGGRRSARAAALLRQKGYDNVQVLQGGMIAWEGERLLEAVGEGELLPDQASPELDPAEQAPIEKGR